MLTVMSQPVNIDRVWFILARVQSDVNLFFKMDFIFCFCLFPVYVFWLHLFAFGYAL